MFSLERTASQRRTERRTIHSEDRFTILFFVITYLQEYSLNTIYFLPPTALFAANAADQTKQDFRMRIHMEMDGS